MYFPPLLPFMYSLFFFFFTLYYIFRNKIFWFLVFFFFPKLGSFSWYTQGAEQSLPAEKARRDQEKKGNWLERRKDVPGFDAFHIGTWKCAVYSVYSMYSMYSGTRTTEVGGGPGTLRETHVGRSGNKGTCNISEMGLENWENWVKTERTEKTWEKWKGDELVFLMQHIEIGVAIVDADMGYGIWEYGRQEPYDE